MIDNPKIRRMIPFGTRIHDPVVFVNRTTSEIWNFINRDLSDAFAPTRIVIRPGEYFDLPHMNYNIYPGGNHGECHVEFLKGRHRETFLKKIPRGLKEAKSGSLDS